MRRVEERVRKPRGPDAPGRHAGPHEPADLPELLPASQPPVRRRANRAAHLHLQPRAGRRRPHQQLDGPGGGEGADRRPLPRQHARPDDARHPLPHGAGGLVDEPGGRHGVGQPLRHREHAHHDARGPGGLRPHAERGRLRARPPRPGRPLAAAALHPPLPRGEADLERRLRLRRQRAARQEVPRAADRVGPGAAGRLARRAHADPRRGGAGRPGDVSRRGDAERLRQDQPRHGHLEAHRLPRVDGG